MDFSFTIKKGNKWIHGILNIKITNEIAWYIEYFGEYKVTLKDNMYIKINNPYILAYMKNFSFIFIGRFWKTLEYEKYTNFQIKTSDNDMKKLKILNIFPINLWFMNTNKLEGCEKDNKLIRKKYK